MAVLGASYFPSACCKTFKSNSDKKKALNSQSFSEIDEMDYPPQEIVAGYRSEADSDEGWP